MKVISSLRASVMQNVRDWFSGASYIMRNPYHVYGEGDLRNADATILSPHLFVLDYGVQYEYRHLPLVLVQMETQDRGLELGSVNTYHNDLALHIVAKNRGERDDLASAIIENVGDLSIYHFNSGGSAVYSSTVGLTPNERGELWQTAGHYPATQAEAQSGALSNWVQLITEFWYLGNAISG